MAMYWWLGIHIAMNKHVQDYKVRLSGWTGCCGHNMTIFTLPGVCLRIGNSQVFDILTLLNFMQLLTFPAVQSTEQKDSNES